MKKELQDGATQAQNWKKVKFSNFQKNQIPDPLDYTGLVRKSRNTRHKGKAGKKPIEKAVEPEIQEIKDFFKNCKLDHLTQTFLNNGFDEMDIILEVESDHLIDMEVGPND